MDGHCYFSCLVRITEYFLLVWHSWQVYVLAVVLNNSQLDCRFNSAWLQDKCLQPKYKAASAGATWLARLTAGPLFVATTGVN